MSDTACTEDPHPAIPAATLAASPAATPAASPVGTPAPQAATEAVSLAAHLRPVPGDEARLWTRLGAGCRLPLQLPAGDAAAAVETVWLEILPAGSPVSGPCPSAPEGRVALAGPAGTLWIDDGAAFVLALTGIELDPGDGPDEPAARAAWQDNRQWLAGAATAALHAAGWPAQDHIVLPEYGPRSASGVRTHADDVLPTGTLRRLALRLRTEDHVHATQGWAEDACWLDRLHGTAPMPGPARLDDAVVHSAVVVARHRLQGHTLRSLRPGSLIRPMHAWSVDGRGTWRLGAQRWQTRLTDQGLELEQMMDDTPYANPDAADGEDTGHASALAALHADTPIVDGSHAGPRVDDLPITLQFDAGHVRLTVAEAARLAPGAVLSLQDAPGRAQVVIRAGGVALGLGELVDVDGQLAVQVLRWTGASPTGYAS